MTDVQTNINNGEDMLSKSPFGSSFRRKAKKYSKEELLRLYEPLEQYYDGFTVFPTVASAKALEPVNMSDSFKFDKEAKINPEFPVVAGGRGRGSALGRGRGGRGGLLGSGLGSPTSLRGRGRGLGSPIGTPDAYKPAWATTKTGGLEDNDSLDLGEDEDAPMSLESLSANTKLASSSWKKETPNTDPHSWKGSLRVNIEKQEEQPAAHIIDDTKPTLKNVNMDSLWYYLDKNQQLQGPYTLEKLSAWVDASFFAPDLKVKASNDNETSFVVLSDVINAAKQNESKSRNDKEHHEGDTDMSFGEEGIQSVLDVISADDHEEHSTPLHPMHQHIHSPLLAQQFQHQPTSPWPGNFQRTPSGGFVPYTYQQPVQHSPFHQPTNMDMMFGQQSPAMMHQMMQQQQLQQMYMLQQLQQQEMQRQMMMSQNAPLRADQLEDELKQALNILPRTPQPQPPSTPSQTFQQQQQPPQQQQQQQVMHQEIRQSSPIKSQQVPQAEIKTPTNAWGSNNQQEAKKSPAKKEEKVAKKVEEVPIVEKQSEKSIKKESKKQPEKSPAKEQPPQEQRKPEIKEQPKTPISQPEKPKKVSKPEPVVQSPIPTPSPTTRGWGTTPVTQSSAPIGDLSTILKQQQKESKKAEKEKKKNQQAEIQAKTENVAWGNAAYMPAAPSLLEIQQEEQHKKKIEEENKQQQAQIEKSSTKGKINAVVSGQGIVGGVWGATNTSGNSLKQIQQEEQSSKKKEKKETKQTSVVASTTNTTASNNAWSTPSVPQQQQKQQEKKKEQKKEQKKEPQQQASKKDDAAVADEEEEEDLFWDYDENNDDEEEKEEPSRAFSTGPVVQPKAQQQQPVTQPAPSASKSSSKKKKKETKAPAKGSSYAAILGPSSISTTSVKNNFPALGGASSGSSSGSSNQGGTMLDDLFPALPKSKAKTQAQPTVEKKNLTPIQQLLAAREKEKQKSKK